MNRGEWVMYLLLATFLGILFTGISLLLFHNAYSPWLGILAGMVTFIIYQRYPGPFNIMEYRNKGSIPE